MKPTMQMKPMIKKLVLMSLMLIIPCLGFAQSASESYNKGITLMNKAEYAEAIRCFRASMAINKSAANVKKCKAQISKCQRLQKRSSASQKPVVEPPKLNISDSLMTFPANREQTIAVKVEISPEKSDWTASFAIDVNWCRLAKSMDGNELHVTCLPSNSTIQRTAKVNVVFGDLTRSIDIIQQGKEVYLSTNAPSVSFSKRKGGSKVVLVNCESDTLYTADKNWIIEEHPNWCVIEEYLHTFKVTVNKLTKKDEEFKTGRSGDIIIRSQNKKCIFNVEQK